MARKQYSNIAFEGGGIKGIAYVGVLKAFNDLNISHSLSHFIGTSVGSIFALLMSCRCSNDEIDIYSKKLFTELTKVNHNIFVKCFNLLKYDGLYDNINIYNAINDFFTNKYNVQKMTFSELYKLTSNELIIVGTCLSTRKVYYFNYVNNPDMEVAKAIQISTCVPIFYKTVEYNNMDFADGGIVLNFPVNYFDKNTIGICFKDNDVNKHYSGLVSLMEVIEDTQLSMNISLSMKNQKPRDLVIIDTGDISFLDFNISQEQIDTLEQTGYDTTKKKLSYISWTEYFSSFFRLPYLKLY